MTEPIIATVGVEVRFGATHALKGVDLDVRPGTVHAIVGENGAGKSTFLGVLAGRVSPTRGEVLVDGTPLVMGDPRRAMERGIVAVYQELSLIPDLNAHKNVFLGAAISQRGLLENKAMRRRYLELCETLGVPAAGERTPVRELTIGQQQLIEIMRALVRDARVMLLDEPTAALSITERNSLFSMVRTLKQQGMTVVLVTHNLDEVFEHSDVISVFRDGTHVQTRPTPEWSRHEVVKAMLGDRGAEALVAAAEGSARARRRGGTSEHAPSLVAEAVSLPGRLADVSVTIARGEVLGLAGLAGSGRSSLLRALAGAERASSGKLWIEGQRVRWPRSTAEARSLGISFIPEDRKSEGLALGRSCAENVQVGDFGSSSRWGFHFGRRVPKSVLQAMAAAGMDTRVASRAAATLSGGNQQKLLFARWIYSPPKVLLCDEPTRGVDVGAKSEILERVKAMARDRETAVIFASSELEEIVAYCDAAVVLAGGRTAGVFGTAESPDLTAADLLDAAFTTPGRAQEVGQA